MSRGLGDVYKRQPVLSEVRLLVLIVRCIPAAAAVIVLAEIFPAHAGQVVRLLRLQDMSAKHHFKKSFLRQKKQTPSVVRRCLYGGRIIGSFCGWRQFLPAGRR